MSSLTEKALRGEFDFIFLILGLIAFWWKKIVFQSLFGFYEIWTVLLLGGFYVNNAIALHGSWIIPFVAYFLCVSFWDFDFISH